MKAVCSAASLVEAGAMLGADQAFRAVEIGGAELHRRRAEHERRRDPARVADPAGRDDRHATASTICGSSAIRPICSSGGSSRKRPAWPPASQPCAMIASTPRSASARASADGRRVADDLRAGPPHPLQQAPPSGRPKWKLTSSGRACFHRRAQRLVERPADGAAARRPASTPCSSIIGPEQRRARRGRPRRPACRGRRN